MKRIKAAIIPAVLSALVLSGCSAGNSSGSLGSGGSASSGSGSSRSGSSASLNPLNWFSRAKARKTTAADTQNRTTDPRQLIEDVASLRVNRTPGGAIVRATGLPPTQGYWDGALLPENDGKPVKGVLSYRFVIAPPTGYQPSLTPQSREIVVARFISTFKLDGVHKIRIVGLRNQRTSRR